MYKSPSRKRQARDCRPNTDLLLNEAKSVSEGDIANEKSASPKPLEEMDHAARINRDWSRFYVTNNAIINFADGTLKLDNN